MWKKTGSKQYLRRDIFDKYHKLMQSPDTRTKIVALQKLDELLRDGQVLLPADGDKLDTYLLNLLNEGGIGAADKDAVRRCAYRLCARRYNPKIRDACLKLLRQEVCLDNKMSIIPVLFQAVDPNQVEQYIPELEKISGLSYQQIKLALFAGPNSDKLQLEKKFVYYFLDKNDITALRFLPVIFDERPQNLRDGLEVLNSDLFGELAIHDDPWVQKYALGTFPKMKKFRINDMNIAPDKFLSLDTQPQKWVMTDMFLDRKFVRQHQDFIKSVLSEEHLFSEKNNSDSRIKEGIAQGLLHYGYNTDLAKSVISWYAQEKDLSIKVLLRSYMMRYRKRNKEFAYALMEEMTHNSYSSDDSGLYLPTHIKVEKSLLFSGAYGIKSQHSTVPLKNGLSEYEKESIENTGGGKMSDKKTKILISHSTIDKDYANELVELIEYLGVRPDTDTLICTSVAGYKIPLGEDIYDYLKYQFDNYDLHVIFLLSDNYYNSPACLNEMGATWIVQKKYTIISLPGFEFQKIKGAINPNDIGIKLDGDETDTKERLGQLKDDIIQELNLSDPLGIRWETKRDNFIKQVKELSRAGKQKN